MTSSLAGFDFGSIFSGIGSALGGLFREHVMGQFETTLTQQLDQLTARLAFDAGGQPQIDPQALS
ncbi:MAG: hypothetical protein B7Z53_00290, partial [Rhodospirillales bacterium 12-71-4]